MAGNAAGEGEALEEPLHAILVARDVGADFRVAAVQPVLRNHSDAAVAGAGEIDLSLIHIYDDFRTTGGVLRSIDEEDVNARQAEAREALSYAGYYSTSMFPRCV